MKGPALTGELAGRVAVVTGGVSGIGRGVAERFLAESACVVVADVDRDGGERLAEALGPDAAFRHTDVSDAGQMRELVAFAVRTYGGLDIMVNNAGVSGARHPRLLDDDFGDFGRVMGVNLLGVMTGTREAARHMAVNGGGSVINISSVGGVQPAPGLWSYHASKAAVIMFTKSAAIDLGGYAIRVNCIAPGNVETPILGSVMAAGLPEEEKNELMAAIRDFILSRQPLRRQGTTADTAAAAVYFAGDRSAYITGTVLPVDGGLLAGSPAASGGLEGIRKRIHAE